ncbi:MAG: HEAT repeat domain-containing protein [Planctomycetes bacterium]|nr:HEAT repeat domain-containing protein [Planctomycetota bacterium]
MTSPQFAVCLALLGLAASLSAHGGQYRGPTPAAGVKDPVPIPASWQAWWESNGSPFLRAETGGANRPVTGSDDFFLGRRRQPTPPDSHAATPDDRRDKIVPALVALLDAERNRDIQSAGLIALGKVGLDAPGIDLQKVLLARVPRDDQEVRETAVLALGIAGRKTSVPMLVALARDDKDGRKLVEDTEVGPRVRTFAVYALAVLARRSGDDALRREIYTVMRELLLDRSIESRDLRVAAALGIGILGATPERSSGKLLAWQAVETLLGWYQQDLGAGEEFLQAHAPISIARLLGRGDSEMHRRCKQVFIDTLEANSRRGNPLLRSAAIALGAMALPSEEYADDAAASRALQHAYEAGREEHVRMFCVMGLARIGGAGNRAWMLREYPRGNKLMEKPWLAIGLGLLASGSARTGAVDTEIGKMLLNELLNASHEDLRTPLVIAIGLSGYRDAAPAVLRMLIEHSENERIAGYLCMALGMLGDKVAKTKLVEVLESSKRRSFVLYQAAVALAQLGDTEVTKRLLLILRESDSVAVLSSIASAINRIGDRRAIDELIALTTDPELPKLGKAFVAAALGGVGDKDDVPWNQPLMIDANYSSAVDTLSNGYSGILDIL